MIRPGVEASATYEQDGRITELKIAPATPDLIKSRGRGLSQELVNAIIDELVPLAARGKYVIAENDCAGSSRTYEKVTIYYNAAPEGRVYYAVVRWNGKIIPRVL